MRSRLGFLLLSALLPRSEETEFTFEGGPELYLRELTFDGKAYTIRGRERDETYQHLLYFPDVPTPSLSSTYETATYYILADDEPLNWPEIFRSWYTSSLENPVRSRAIYTEYVWREESP